MQNGYRQQIQNELTARVGRNAKYSIRAFAKALGIDAGTLSRVLAGKQIPSAKLALRILDGLTLGPAERAVFLASLEKRQRARRLRRVQHFPSVNIKAQPLAVDSFHLIADWYHIAILELCGVDDFRAEMSWIAKRLKISQVEARVAVERLLRLGLLTKTKSGWRKTDAQLSTAGNPATNEALVHNQKQLLNKAVTALEERDIATRSMTAMTMAIDPDKIAQAKLLIRQFNRRMSRLLESGPRKSVYTLEIALFPLDDV